MGYITSASAPPKGVKAEPILPWGATAGEDITDSTGGEDEMVSGGEGGALDIAAAHAHRANMFCQAPLEEAFFAASSYG